MIINNNMTALNAVNHLSRSTTKLDKTFEKLSSGLRITKAADDAAGLAISQKFKSQIGGSQQALRNIQDGISLVQTVDGGLNEIHNLLQRMRTLASQSANDTLTAIDRNLIYNEVQQIQNEIDHIATDTEFNKINVLGPQKRDPPPTLNGKADVLFLIDQTGSMSSWVSNLRANLPAFIASLQSKGVTDLRMGLSIYRDGGVIESNFGGSLWTNNFSDIDAVLAGFSPSGVDETVIDAIVDTMGDYSFHIGANGDQAGHIVLVTDSGTAGDVHTVNDAIAALNSQNVVLHGAYDTVGLNPSEPSAPIDTIIQQTGGSKINSHLPTWGNSLSSTVGKAIGSAATNGSSIPLHDPIMIQVGANQGQQLQIDPFDARSSKLGVDMIDVSSSSGAQSALTSIDKAIEKVSSARSQFGTSQSALEHTYSNVSNYAENTTASESRLADADMAKEMYSLVKEQIISSAATSMLAQANVRPQSILRLLSGI